MSTFDEVLAQVMDLLQREGRVAYRVLKRRFALDDEYIEDLKADLIDAKRLAVDEDGKVLVWVGAAPVPSAEFQVPSPTQPPAPNTQPPEAERRQLTVMFCDLVGSTALSAQLDPEELREVVRAYQQTSAAVIERFGGHIAQYLGDGLLVYFCYPVAHEDDAQRAVRAGLEIVEAIRGQGSGIGGQEGPQSLSTRLFHQLQVRIGIHTGPVVVGEMGGGTKRELLALGETPNLAARIQGQAAPNEVVMSAATYRLVEGLFECEDRGQPELKGVSTPLTLYRVLKEGQAQSRFEVVVRRGLTPLIGREHEYGLLRARWEQAKSGEGQGVLLSGEPGIGKSRLVEALKESVEHEGASCLEFRCSPYHQNSALYPITDHLQRVLGFQSGDSSEEKLRKLAQGLAEQAGIPVIASAAKQSLPETEIASSPAAPRNDNPHLLLFAALLSLPHPEGYPPITLSPQKQKEKTYEALVAWLCRQTKQQTVTYTWEDLHWADPSTLEVLTLFLAQVPTTRLLAVLTFRPEFVPPWGAHSYLSQLTLSRLGRSHIETMVEKVTGGKALPTEVIQQIVNKTDGVPLFVEELTKSVVESVGSSASLQLGIPVTLQDALMARLDRLGTAKEIAQVGATIGREFAYDLLQAVSPLDEGTLHRGLKRLVEAELVYQRGLLPQAHYLFKHALIQDTAYQSLLKSTRQQYHRQIAQVLEGRFPETVATQPELVAHHYTEAGLSAQAIPYWQQAGERTTQRSAYVEAISHLTRGLEVLKALPDTPERARQELTLQIALGTPLQLAKGHAAPEVEKTVTRARELCQQLGETPQLFPVLFRLVEFYLNRGELRTTHELAEQLMRLAQSVQDPYLLSVVHLGLGATLTWLGELPSARTYVEQALALYDPQTHPGPTSITADLRREDLTPERAPWLSYRWASNTADPRIECLAYAAWTLWPLGYPDQALKRSQEVLVLAEGLSQPFGLAYAFGVAAWCHLVRREGPLAQERAEALMTLSTEQGFPYWLAIETIVLGWALAEQGQVEEGIAQMYQGLVAYRATGAELQRPSFLTLLAEAHRKVGQTKEGLTVLTEVLAHVDKTGERYYEAELHRLKGQLTLQKLSVVSSQLLVTDPRPLTPEPQGEAEACFLKAIEVARKQQAKSLELRATMSLVRLRQQQAMQHVSRNTQHEAHMRLGAAHNMLAEIYGWFTEGFDTKDLQEAKALIQELSH